MLAGRRRRRLWASLSSLEAPSRSFCTFSVLGLRSTGESHDPVRSGGGGIFNVVFPLWGFVLEILAPFVLPAGWTCAASRLAGVQLVMRVVGVATRVMTTMMACEAGSRLALLMSTVRCANGCAYADFWL